MIEHLSPSTIQSYRSCGKRVYFEKILGVENPSKYAMTSYGSAMHRAIEVLYKENLTKEKFKEAFLSNWDELSQQVNQWKNDSKEYLANEGCLACDDFYDNVYGKYNVELVEQKFEISRGEGSFPILCFADAVTKDGIIIDYKFGRGLSGMADSKSYACNMATYAWAYKEQFNKMPTKIVFIKEKWKKYKDQDTGKYMFKHDSFVIDEKDVKESEIEFYQNVYDNVEIGIQAGMFLPAPDDSFLCQSCGYRIMGLCNKGA
jgi:CRISPR/Cas system-associated exonuclease Cas4 (RecB family)